MKTLNIEKARQAKARKDTTDPFRNNRDPDFYFASRTHDAALKLLRGQLERHDDVLALLTGPAGSGKTYLRGCLYASLEPTRFVRVSIESSLLDFDALLLEIISQASGKRAVPAQFPDRYSRLAEFKRVLAERVIHTNKRLVVFLDEAQALSDAVLECLRQLTNISTASHNVMTIVLVGTEDMLARIEGNTSLADRVAVHASIESLDEEESRAYVVHRMNRAAVATPVRFSNEGWALLHETTAGRPRRINRVMKHALERAREDGNDIIDAYLPDPGSGRAPEGPGLFA